MKRFVHYDLRMNRARRDAATLMHVLGDLCENKAAAHGLLVKSLYEANASLRPNDDIQSGPEDLRDVVDMISNNELEMTE